ncbi:alpha/beta fold hydrolase [Cohnella mopanensis]|uniref:alpha/beta fold hydrolase n=1 Tax=Cohnella mopanensis TaxID=2911966 RepID=UPI001EF7AD15|nr:alpha/beta hydrolase [Cohnella mopanensis]
MKKPIYKRKRYVISLLLLLLLIVFLFFPTWTPAIKDAQGNKLPNSIATLEEISLGGVQQSLLIRGNDRNNPILLFLHGGPGYPQIAYARKYQQQLEKDFIVVNWDQRGSGKSYHWNLTDDDLQVDKLVQDTHELTVYLTERFHQSKIFIVGHSWGSTLGSLTVQRYPESYYAYIGIGQVASSPLGELRSYEFVLREARRLNNAKAIKELEAIGTPPYRNPRKDTTIERKWVSAFGGSERSINTYKDLIRGVLLAPEYSWYDGVKMAVGNSFSANAIMPQTENTNLFESAPEWKVPVYFFMGKYDYMTPSEVAFDYYEQLKAPSKRFIWFEHSAHFPHFEEADLFSEWMVKIKEENL